MFETVRLKTRGLDAMRAAWFLSGSGSRPRAPSTAPVPAGRPEVLNAAVASCTRVEPTRAGGDLDRQLDEGERDPVAEVLALVVAAHADRHHRLQRMRAFPAQQGQFAQRARHGRQAYVVHGDAGSLLGAHDVGHVGAVADEHTGGPDRAVQVGGGRRAQQVLLECERCAFHRAGDPALAWTARHTGHAARRAQRFGSIAGERVERATRGVGGRVRMPLVLRLRLSVGC